MVALTDLGGGTYLGFEGGLYPGGRNEPPADHEQRGLAAGAAVRRLDVHGRPSPTGHYVLLSVGMSNTTQEFCSAGSLPPCEAWSFVGQAAADPAVDHAGLVIVNGAKGGQDAVTWDSPDDPNYDRVRDQQLEPLGLSESQVQIVWIKEADARPEASLPDADADAYRLQRTLGDVVRAVRARYPNVRQIFLSSRTYGGYATTGLNPEPFAYESGFAVKWLIEDQIRQARTGEEGVGGDLDYGRAAWLGWGPYLWAPGAEGRSDGLVWLRDDFVSDGTHPSRSGEEKVGRALLEFFKGPLTAGWFLTG